MRSVYRATYFWLPLLAANCTSPRSHPSAGVVHQGELPILARYQGADSGFTRPLRLVIYDAAGLARLPVQTRPIDFDREMLLFVTLGTAPSRGYSIDIDRVELREDRIHPHLVKSYPSAEQRLPLERTTPFCVVVVPRSELPVPGFDSRFPVTPDHLGARQP